MLNDDEVNALDTAKHNRNELEGFEHAYDATVRAIRYKKLVLEFLGVLLAIGFLYVLYVVKATPQTSDSGTVHDLLGLFGTGLSLAVLLFTLWGHMAKWDGQLEKKHDLSRSARRLVTSYEKFIQERPIPIATIGQLAIQRADFDEARKHELATLPRWAMQQAHQHVAMKYPELKITCKVCNRAWSPDLARRRRWVKMVPYLSCESCGV